MPPLPRHPRQAAEEQRGKLRLASPTLQTRGRDVQRQSHQKGRPRPAPQNLQENNVGRGEGGVQRLPRDGYSGVCVSVSGEGVIASHCCVARVEARLMNEWSGWTGWGSFVQPGKEAKQELLLGGHTALCRGLQLLI